MPLGPRGQVDRFGNPIPAGQSYATIINSDGSVLPPQKIISLDPSVTAIDDPVTGSTKLAANAAAAGALLIANNLSDVADVPTAFDNLARLTSTAYGRALLALANQAALVGLLPNAGTTAGRLRVPVLIDDAATSGTAYTGPTWAAGLYQKIILEYYVISGTPTATVSLTGLTGAYAITEIYANGSTPASQAAAAWQTSMDAGGFFECEMRTKAGTVRTIKGQRYYGAAAYATVFSGNNVDTTHDVTNITIAFSATQTGRIVIWGIPA